MKRKILKSSDYIYPRPDKPPFGYRWLRIGERRREGDLFFCRLTGVWIQTAFIGEPVIVAKAFTRKLVKSSWKK